ncbi:hypothetical protein Ddye_029997 [Dipteronia dyeriana]|uniref:Uncharacterized protein n=1 Tax=Dipteronia dyeriana TaxID=168575 RepID=A0AAD9WM93_9ROSI|nr:hypothetical protein Ddye_029997 [Dipteronia dyeriana]
MRRKPIFTKLVLLKIRSRKKLKSKFKLLKHYNNNNNNNNYRFLEDYQFSASSTPLIDLQHKKQQLKSRIPYMHNGVAVGEQGALEPLDLNQDDDDDDDSVDQRAERFIEWFYQEMRLQRRESI